MPTEQPKVFISYSHDSAEHTRRVHALADRLRTDGIDAWIDQYVQDPDEGWIHWMRSQVKRADRVLLVFTETYQRRFEGDEEEDKGLGATFEGVIVTLALYESGGRNAKFRPVVFCEEDERFIPVELRRFNRYRVDTTERYQKLLRWLHQAPSIVAGAVGPKPDLPSSPGPKLFHSALGKAAGVSDSPPNDLPSDATESTGSGSRSLATLSLTELRRLILERMSRTEVRMLWYAVLEEHMRDSQTLVENVFELLVRAKESNKLALLIEEISKERPDLENPR